MKYICLQYDDDICIRSLEAVLCVGGMPLWCFRVFGSHPSQKLQYDANLKREREGERQENRESSRSA